jgi:alkanesulfonate monooxygenase SsuD/methylene tetrahydromethanopterin reductase-like flavin-dependent oxidoreductase (luciferase family)
MFLMRFAMRSDTSDPEARAVLYAAAIEMCAWAEGRGAIATVLSQHHGAEDGYLPSPIPLAAAVAARTESLPISVAALLLALYEPVKLAEDMAVVDLISRGRVSYVVGIGYRPEEFAMFGIDRGRRALLVEDRITLLRLLWEGNEVDVDGRPVRVTPRPFTPGGPMLAYGGGTEAAARRAARLGMVFMAETHDSTLEEAYRAEGGESAPGCFFPPAGVPLTVFVADDPERAWADIGRYLLSDAVSYAGWNASRSGTASLSQASTVADLAAEKGAYQIVTPAGARELLRTGFPLNLQPLVGGIPPDLAWPYLEAAASASESAAAEAAEAAEQSAGS